MLHHMLHHLSPKCISLSIMLLSSFTPPNMGVSLYSPTLRRCVYERIYLHIYIYIHTHICIGICVNNNNNDDDDDNNDNNNNDNNNNSI